MASHPRRIHSSQMLWLVRLTIRKINEASDATRLWRGSFTTAHSKDASCMLACSQSLLCFVNELGVSRCTALMLLCSITGGTLLCLYLYLQPTAVARYATPDLIS